MNKTRHPVEQPSVLLNASANVPIIPKVGLKFLEAKDLIMLSSLHPRYKIRRCMLTGCNSNEPDRIPGFTASGLFSLSNPHLTLDTITSWQKPTGRQGSMSQKGKPFQLPFNTRRKKHTGPMFQPIVCQNRVLGPPKLWSSCWLPFKPTTPLKATQQTLGARYRALRSRPAELVAQPPQTSSA